jgi:hypothetical protein
MTTPRSFEFCELALSSHPARRRPEIAEILLGNFPLIIFIRVAADLIAR